MPAHGQAPEEPGDVLAVGLIHHGGNVSLAEVMASWSPGFRPVVAFTSAEEHARYARVLERKGVAAEVASSREDQQALFARNRVAGVTTFDEAGVESTAWIAEELGLRGLGRVAAGLVVDKHQQRARLAADGLSDGSVLTTKRMLSAQLPELRFPVVIKPRFGSGSRLTFPVASAAELERIVPRLGDDEEYVLEPMLRGVDRQPYGDYVSVESVIIDRQASTIAVTDKLPLVPPFRELGQFTPSTLRPGEITEIVDLAAGAIDSLGIEDGLTHTEIKLTPDGPRIIEVNGRLGGLVDDLVRRAGGIDLVHAAAAVACGRMRETSLQVAGDVLAFQYAPVAPRAGGHLTAVDGENEVRRLPGIKSVLPHVRVGDVLAPSVETRTLGLISGVAESHHDMLRTIERIDATMTYTFRSEGGEEAQFTAGALRSQ